MTTNKEGNTGTNSKSDYSGLIRNNAVGCNSELLSEKDKEREEYFICMIDSIISELNYNKTEMKENFMYYNLVLCFHIIISLILIIKI